jgi:hypothetical protein
MPEVQPRPASSGCRSPLIQPLFPGVAVGAYKFQPCAAQLIGAAPQVRDLDHERRVLIGTNSWHGHRHISLRQLALNGGTHSGSIECRRT